MKTFSKIALIVSTILFIICVNWVLEKNTLVGIGLNILPIVLSIVGIHLCNEIEKIINNDNNQNYIKR